MSFQNDVLDFLGTNHDIKESKISLAKARFAEKRVNSILLSVPRGNSFSKELKQQYSECADRCRQLKALTRNTQKDLVDDISALKQAALADVAKASFLLGVPISVYMAAKNGLLNGTLSPEDAGGIASLGTTIIVGRRAIAKNIKLAAERICRRKNREQRSGLRSQFRKAGQALSRKSAATAKRIIRSVTSFFSHKPKQ